MLVKILMRTRIGERKILPSIIKTITIYVVGFVMRLRIEDYSV